MRPGRRPESEEAFIREQRTFFAGADSARFRWQTQHPYVSAAERELVRVLRRYPPGLALLEVGCGEGANLWHLGQHFARVTALDFSLERVRFCRAVNSGVTAVCADALSLPFADRSFDVVFCRDLLHHLPPSQRPKAVDELHRVCVEGGSLVLIESNGRNPLIQLHGLLIPAESGQRSTSPDLFRQLLSDLTVTDLKLVMAGPLPLYLLLLHPRFGLPQLGGARLAARLLDAVTSWAEALLSRERWAYCIATARKGSVPQGM